jgi:hypothetical protein
VFPEVDGLPPPCPLGDPREGPRSTLRLGGEASRSFSFVRLWHQGRVKARVMGGRHARSGQAQHALAEVATPGAPAEMHTARHLRLRA